MNTITQAETTALIAINERAAAAMNSGETERQLIELAGSTQDIVVITNKDGREQCHRAHMVAKNTRIAIERLAKDVRDDANKFSQSVIAEEARLVGLIKPEEERLKTLRDAFDQKEAEEKAAKKAAEEARVAGIKAKIQRFEQLVMDAALKQFAADVKGILAEVEAIEIDDSFAEFVGEAREARGKAKQTLQAVIVAKETAEQVAAQVAEQNRKMQEQLAELQRQNAELAKNQAPKTEEAPAALPQEATVAEPVVPFVGHASAAVDTCPVVYAELDEPQAPVVQEAPAWLPEAEKAISAFLNGREWPKGKANEYRAVLIEYEKSKHTA